MSDLVILFLGVVVTAFVGAAVGVLLWGAGQEHEVRPAQRVLLRVPVERGPLRRTPRP